MALACMCATALAGVSGRADGHVLVQFRPDEARRLLGTASPSIHVLEAALQMPAGAKLEESGFNRWARMKRPPAARADTATDLSRFLYLRLPPGMSPEDCVERLRRHPLVEYVEPDYLVTAGATYPTDPRWSLDQWHLGSVGSGRIRAPEGWDYTTGSTAITVAVLDTGCDTNILEFSGRHVPGYNFAQTNNNPADADGHGTAVAATLCASANNATNGAGVDWQCKLMPVKVLLGVGESTNWYSWVADGIDWAVSNGAKVINFSAGGTNHSAVLSNAVYRAVSNGAIFVTVTHNDARSWVRYPGAYPVSIAVGAVDMTGTRCGFSNYGTNITLMAPGTNIYTAGIGGAWGEVSGTSFAAPQVAGTASLLCALRPGLRQEQVKALLCAGARDQVSASDTNDLSGYDFHYGWGILDVSNTLMLASTEVTGFVPTNSSDIAMTWRCPANAWTNRPFVVAHAGSLASNVWITASNVTYAGDTAMWVDTNIVQDTRFYRIVVPPR
jgi:thermitase